MNVHETRIFVSYTRRDGMVTEQMLRAVQAQLQRLGRPFIHALSDEGGFEQWTVVRQVLGSHIVVVLESPGVYKSPWVKLELFLARLTLTPTIRLGASRLEHYLRVGVQQRPAPYDRDRSGGSPTAAAVQQPPRCLAELVRRVASRA